MSGHVQGPAIYAAPWRERLPSGELGAEYGPSPATFARHLRKFKQWSWRPEPKRLGDLGELEAYVYPDGLDAGPRAEVTPREVEVFNLLHFEGLGRRQAAERMGLSRSSVRTYVRRLKERADL